MDGVVEVHPAIEQHDLLAVPCNDPSHELRPVLDRYELCSRAPADLSGATTMNREDAFRVTRYLHSKLVFVTDFSANIRAFPLTSDLLELCGLDSQRPGFEALCNFAQQGAETIARLNYIVLAENEGLSDWLASRMSDLYGVRCADGRVPGVTCTAPGPAGGCVTAGYATCVKPCVSSAECEGVEEGPECNGVCGVWSSP
jgi:hypothetical protein